MILHPTVLIIWATLAACFLAVLAYRGQLTRYEDDQLFLDENIHQNEHKQQDEILRKVNRLQPVVRVLGGAAGLMTASIIGMYTWNAWQLLQH